MKKRQQGSALLLVIIVFATLFALLGISLERGISLFKRIQTHYVEDVALNLAEAGVEYTIHQLIVIGDNFQGKENVMLDGGTFSTLVVRPPNAERFEILSTGTATGNRWVGDVVKTLRVSVRMSSNTPEQPPEILSWEEISQDT